MMFDLMIKGVSLTDDIGEFDVACKDGKIVEIAKSILGFFFSIYLFIFVISFKFEAPVESIIGFLHFSISSINIKLVRSADAILKNLTSLFRKIIDFLSNPVDKKSIL